MADVRATLEAALRAIHDPRTLSVTRHEAQAFASSFIQRPDSVPLAVELFRLHTQLASQQHASNNTAAVVESDSVRHFALNVLQRRVRGSWDELPGKSVPPGSLMSSCTHSPANCRSFNQSPF
jgi:hypothetical protein